MHDHSQIPHRCPTRRFKIAVNALRLENPHAVIMKEIPHWTEDTGSEEEDSDEYEKEVLDCAVCGLSISNQAAEHTASDKRDI